MSESMIWITQADFINPNEGRTASVDRITLAATHYRVTHEALKVLICLTALASGSDQVVSLTIRTADLNELETHELVKWSAHDKVVLL